MKKILFLCFFSVFAFSQEPKKLPEIPALSVDANKQTQDSTNTMPTPQVAVESKSVESQNLDSKEKPQTIENSQNNPQAESQNADSTNQTANQTQTQSPLIKATDSTTTKKERDPFTPVFTPKTSGQITNAPQLNLFTKTEMLLPSTARKIKKISLEYQNLNGSISTIEQELDGDIDWHFPLILSQEVQPKVPNIPTSESFNLKGFFDISLTKNTIGIDTNLPMIREFTLASPYRLVLDFQAPLNDSGGVRENLVDSFKPSIPIVREISLNTHLDFYRLTIFLDGQYKYDLKTDAKLHKITLY
ncbi:MAG: AMIN domain-containing protein [Helicobacteraceae bacterium]|nr:AMIN domain-containing protein [Helicobacteraceae bacterium]